MKQTITKLALCLSLSIFSSHVKSQSIETFDSFTITPNSYYNDVNSNNWTGNGGLSTFEYGWNTAWGGYWESGSAYTNVQDTTDGTYTNLYGASSYTAYSGSNYATVQSGSIIKFNPSVTVNLNGFYITNTSYAWKEMRDGGFGRKFGDTTGTNSGGLIEQGEYPDWFKLIIKGYQNGALKTNTVEFYLADYRAVGTTNDYIVRDWRYVDCSSLGVVDSIAFDMASSDNNAWGMKTPAFFSIDDFSIQNVTNVKELTSISNISLFPNPTSNNINVDFKSESIENTEINITDISGKLIYESSYNASVGENNININTSNLNQGIYFIELKNNNNSKKIKFVKL